MQIEHIAIWCKDIEVQKNFYIKYFNATSNTKYINTTKNFQSYFLAFDSGCRIELMQMPTIKNSANLPAEQYFGLNHFAVKVGTQEKVIDLTEQLRNDGYSVIGEPRLTGDGYFESVILDPEGNRVEIVC
ncbi:MAG TPA: VOC family protein [Bacillota bacterium]|mgnify:CR=1 FL=1|jgi:lactoylglutathione lyase|nr:VOC family protein [Bacillota bacterium]HOL10894.1 VOC family protein [Bacillota bacterium]HPO98778.1 VOC family protein [Bacillota bacterium]